MPKCYNCDNEATEESVRYFGIPVCHICRAETTTCTSCHRIIMPHEEYNDVCGTVYCNNCFEARLHDYK